MRVSGPSGARPLAPKQKAGKASSQGSGFSIETSSPASGSPAASPVAGTAGLSSVDALLALQGVDDEKESRKQAVARAKDILDILDELKVGLLNGTLPMGRLRRLLWAIQSCERFWTKSICGLRWSWRNSSAFYRNGRLLRFFAKMWPIFTGFLPIFPNTKQRLNPALWKYIFRARDPIGGT